MQKADSNSSAGTKADSSTKDENILSSSHDTKPNVSGLPSFNKKSVSDLVRETCPQNQDGSYDVSAFDFDKAYKELGFKRAF